MVRLPVFHFLLLILSCGLISCGETRKLQPAQPTVQAAELAEYEEYEEYEEIIAFEDEDACIRPHFIQFVKVMDRKVEFKDGNAYRRFKGDPTRYRILPDTLYPLDGGRGLLLARCIPREGPCSHADAAYFQLVVFENASSDPTVLQESRLLPVYSPWCDKLEPRFIQLRGVPHILFEISDAHQGNAHSEFWMVSAGQTNFGDLVWHEDVNTATYTMGESDSMLVFEEQQMEATVDFDTSHCLKGFWVMNISKTTTKRLSDASLGEPSPESERRVASFKPVVKEERLQTVYRLSRDGRLVEW